MRDYDPHRQLVVIVVRQGGGLDSYLVLADGETYAHGMVRRAAPRTEPPGPQNTQREGHRTSAHRGGQEHAREDGGR